MGRLERRSPARSDGRDRHRRRRSIRLPRPAPTLATSPFAVQVSRECNEGLAKIAQDHPRRFGGFALLPLPAIKEAVTEAVYALDTLKLDGICLLTHAGQRHLGHPDEDELYAELDRRHAVVFIHPLRNQAQNVPAYGYPAGMTELVVDTTRAVANLLWHGTFGRFPNIRWIMPHGAGTVPFLAYRLSAMDKKPHIRQHLPGGSVAGALARALLRRGRDRIARAAQMPDGNHRHLAHPVRQRLPVFAAQKSRAGRSRHDQRIRGVRRLERIRPPRHRIQQRREAVSAAGERSERAKTA